MAPERHQSLPRRTSERTVQRRLRSHVVIDDAAWRANLPKPFHWTRTIMNAVSEGIADCPALGGSLAVLLADDATLMDLNNRFRGKNKPTNVLSFPAPPMPWRKGTAPLGDIALAFETVHAEALRARKSFVAHATHLLVHGTLHLLGYTHDDEEDAGRMMRGEILILGQLGIANPYAGRIGSKTGFA